MKKHVRTTITVPEVIKKQMKERPDLNWSRIATVAFAEALNIPPPPVKPDSLKDRVAALEKKLESLT